MKLVTLDQNKFIKQMVQLDRSINAAEHDAIESRWKFGNELLKRRVGKKLPTGLLDELIEETGKSRAELKFRMQLVETYPDRRALANALANGDLKGKSWHDIVQSFGEERRMAQRKSASERAGIPSGKFRVIYADPPWSYGDQLTPDYGPTKFHYPTMSIEELCAMPVKDHVDDNAVLFLWVTSPLLDECWPVIEAWGFEYKTSFVWDKVKHNMGHYNSVRHELLLVCTRGSCVPDVKNLYDSVVTVERTKHSTKPQEFRDMIETLYPLGARLELFAREEHRGWTVHGNQIERPA